jgi:hypothetical protein
MKTINKPKKVQMKAQTGLGVVGTWVFPQRNLGGSLPLYLSDSQKGAIMEANTNQRLLQFLDRTEQWLCEITVTPIRKVKPKRQFSE